MKGPTLIEALTYRYEEHSLGLGRVRRGEYRTQDQIDEWRERDPIDVLERTLTSQGILTQEECDAISKAKEAEVEEAVEFARNSPYPEPEELFDDMWADPIPAP